MGDVHDEQPMGGAVLRIRDKQHPKQAPAELQASRPNIPPHVAKLIADPFEYDDGSKAEWQMPDTLPAKTDLDAARRQLEAHLAPAPEKFIRECLARLAIVLGHRDGQAGTWQARAQEYIRLLGQFPADIWQRGCDEVALQKGQRFFPEPSVLREAMTRLVDRRHAALWRVNAMLKKADSQREKPFVDDPRPVKLKAIIASWRKLPDASAVKGMLARSAINAEVELARIENRPPEAWAMAPAQEPEQQREVSNG